MKTMGVLGGMGPQATMDFERRVHLAAQKLLPQKFNTGYPPMIVYYHRGVPFALDENGSPRSPMTPDPGLVTAAKRLGALCDFLIIAANAPHLLQEDIEEASGKPVLSMIDVTMEEIRRRGWRTVGLLGFGAPVVYSMPMVESGISFHMLKDKNRLDGAIGKCMEGRADGAAHRLTADAVNELRARGVDGVILGCTEIPLLLGEDADSDDLLNPAALLAEAAVRHAMA